MSSDPGPGRTGPPAGPADRVPGDRVPADRVPVDRVPADRVPVEPVPSRGSATRTGRVADQVHHHAVFQEEIAPVESYGVLPSAVITVAAAIVAVVTLATGAGAGTHLWFVRPSAVFAVLIGVVGTPVLVRRRRIVRARRKG